MASRIKAKKKWNKATHNLSHTLNLTYKQYHLTSLGEAWGLGLYGKGLGGEHHMRDTHRGAGRHLGGLGRGR